MRRSFLVTVAAITLAGTLGSGAALADLCKKPRVRVVNGASNTIKVKKIQYKDGCEGNKWRSEEVTNSEIPKGGDTLFEDNLEYVEGCTIPAFKVYYAVRSNIGAKYGKYVWSATLTPSQGPKVVCKTHASYTITVK